MHRLRIFSILPILFALATPVFGQGDESGTSTAPANEADAGASGTVIPEDLEALREIPVEELGQRLRPLTLEELEAEKTVALGLLKDVSTRFIEADLAGNDETATELSELRTSLVLRINRLLMAVERKGGDVANDRKYVEVASGGITEADFTDIGGMTKSAKDWLVSEDGGIRVGLAIVRFIVIMIITWIVARIVSRLVKRSLRKFDRGSELLRVFLVNLARKVIMLLGLIIAVTALGVNTAPLLAAIGAAGLVIGLALSDTLSNFAAGILILLYQPYDIDDVIEGGGTSGKVKSMNLVSTTMTTPDNQEIIVPNSSIWGGTIVNVTANDTRRVDLVMGCGYDDDLDRAQAVLLEVVAAHPLVLKSPEPVVQVSELADSSVNFVVRPWSKTSDYWTVYWDLHKQVKQRFDEEGIAIPYPQRDIHVHQVAPG